MSNDNRISEIESELQKLSEKKKSLLAELKTLNRPVNKPVNKTLNRPVKSPKYGVKIGLPYSTAQERLSFFLKLFRCRQDIYPHYWESKKSGKKGYSPVCTNEWVSGICRKPKIKCSDCGHQAFKKFDEEVALSHLQGKEIVGTYTLKQNNKCSFLAADFDKTTWKKDIAAFKKAASEIGVDVAMERSRSGNGGHAWIFFQEDVSAYEARQLGTLILTLAMIDCPELPLDSFDRLFPSQDYMPSGGFGNLIALPLQRRARNSENSVFVDDDFDVLPNQWEYLANTHRLSEFEVESILKQHLPNKDKLALIADDPEVATAEALMKGFVKKKSIKKSTEKSTEKSIEKSTEKFDGELNLILKNQIYIDYGLLPKKLIASLRKLTTFANPEFFKLQRMRFSTWGKPRYISSCSLEKNQLVLPRGVLDQTLEALEQAGMTVSVIDQRIKPKRLKVKFMGELRKDQKKAVSSMSKHDFGVLVAPPGVGKTVMGCSLIAKRKVPTLILVHRKPLMDQWIERINEFLDIEPKEIGSYDGSRKKLKGKIDVAMLQTLNKLEDSADLLSNYGQVIIDECHHIPAVSFENTMKKISSQYFVGLTATPIRKDGLQAILHMQCGPIRYEMEEFGAKDLEKISYIRETDFNMRSTQSQPPIHEVWEQLIDDENRNNQIAQDILKSLDEGRWPLIISDRKEHLAKLASLIANLIADLISSDSSNSNNSKDYKGFVLVGDFGKKKRKKIFEEIEFQMQERKPFYILSTGSFIGEGVDIPILDTLILGMPISFKGRMKQYAGRIHRPFEGKKKVVIYDYLDPNTTLTTLMFKKRVSAYKEMGYKIESTLGVKIDRILYQKDLFSDFN